MVEELNKTVEVPENSSEDENEETESGIESSDGVASDTSMTEMSKKVWRLKDVRLDLWTASRP
jgi:hypothetical protein